MTRYRVIPAVLVLLLSLTFLSQDSKAQVELVTNGSFETGDFTGWTQQSISGGGDWFVYSGTSTPIFGDPVLPPPDGEFAAVTDQDNPDSNILYQDIAVPPNADVSCSVIVYLVNGNTEGGSTNYIIGDGLTLNSPNQQMRVDLMDPVADPFDTGAGVLQNLFQALPGDPDNIGYTTLNFDLSAYAGQTVRFRAAVVVTQAPLTGSIDELSCQESIVARNIPTLSEWGMIAAAAGLGLAGLFFAMRRRSQNAA